MGAKTRDKLYSNNACTRFKGLEKERVLDKIWRKYECPRISLAKLALLFEEKNHQLQILFQRENTVKPKKYNSINNTIIKCIKRGGENMGIRFYRTKKIQKKEKTKIIQKAEQEEKEL